MLFQTLVNGQDVQINTGAIINEPFNGTQRYSIDPDIVTESQLLVLPLTIAGKFKTKIIELGATIKVGDGKGQRKHSQSIVPNFERLHENSQKYYQKQVQDDYDSWRSYFEREDRRRSKGCK